MGDSVEERIRNCVVEELDVAADQVISGARLYEDLGADSLERSELVLTLEEQFGISIPDGDADRLVTFGDLVEYVTDRIGDEVRRSGFIG